MNPFSFLGGAVKAGAKPVSQVATDAVQVAAPKKPSAIKRTLTTAGLSAGAGWIGNDAWKAFNSPPKPPEPPQYQPDEYKTASEYLLVRLEKTAHKEDHEMSLIDRLNKTANDMAIISALSQATGAAPEELITLAQQQPEQFAALLQQISGEGAAPVEAAPADPAAVPQAAVAPEAGQAAQFAEPAADEEAMINNLTASLPSTDEDQAVPAQVADPAAQVADPAAQVADPAAQVADPAAQVADPAAQVADPAAQVADPAAQVADTAAQVADPAAQVVDPAAQVVDPAAQVVDPAADDEAIINALAMSLPPAGPQENPRAGAASVSHNPAGVDKTASAEDAMMSRLNKVVDAATDLIKAKRAQDQSEKDDGQNKSASELLASLEKTAFALPSVAGMKAMGTKALDATTKYVGDVSGITKRTADKELSAMNTPEALKQHGLPVEDGGMGVAKFRQHLEGLDANVQAAGVAKDKARKNTALYGGVGLAGMGAGSMMSGHQQTAEEELISRLEKIAFLDLSDDEHRALMNQQNAELVARNQAGAAASQVTPQTKAAPATQFASATGNTHVPASSPSKALGKKLLGKAGLIGGGIAAGIGISALSHHGEDKAAGEDLMERLTKSASGAECDVQPTIDTAKSQAQSEKAATPTPAQSAGEATGPIAANGLDGYSEGSTAKTDDVEKNASENEEFMNGIYKEAATAIIESHLPSVKTYSDPMDRIKFTK